MVENTGSTAPRSPRAVSDRNPTTATELGIRGIPTSIVFVNGREAARQTGAVGRAGLNELLARAGAG